MASVVYEPKRAKGAASTGFAMESARRLDASVDASAEEMAGMAPLCGKNWTVFVMHSPCVSGINMC